MLKLIGGMATGYYGLDPNVARNKALSDISSDLERAGVPLSHDTIRKYIAEAKQLLPPLETD